MTLHLSLDQVLRVHQAQVEAFGGSAGLRDRGALEAAVHRPQTTFGGEDLYPDTAAKCAALMHSLIANHPFVDGNKRTAAVVSETFLALNGYQLAASDAELVVAMLALAAGELSEAELADWFRGLLAEA